MKLWLDDAREPPAGWVQVRTVAEAQALLSSGQVEEASLDHDLGPDEPDGSALVRWMALTGHWPRTRPVVHSMNPAGRSYMEAVIDREFGNKQP